MPTYDYKCETCGRVFEHIQTMNSPHLKYCTESVCEQTPPGVGKVQRLITGGSGVIYRGEGFYKTDYKKSKPPEKNDSTKGSAKEPTKESPKDSAKGSAKDSAKGSAKDSSKGSDS